VVSILSSSGKWLFGKVYNGRCASACSVTERICSRHEQVSVSGEVGLIEHGEVREHLLAAFVTVGASSVTSGARAVTCGGATESTGVISGWITTSSEGPEVAGTFAN